MKLLLKTIFSLILCCSLCTGQNDLKFESFFLDKTMHGLISIQPTPSYDQIESLWEELETEHKLQGIQVTPIRTSLGR